MSALPISITGTLCELCHQFIGDLFAFDFVRQDKYPARWETVGSKWTTEKPWGDAFRHYKAFSDLTQSAERCELCNVLHADLAPMGEAMHEGWLGLYPFWSSGRIGQNKLKGHFRAGFRGSLSKMPWGSSIIGSIPLHTFRVCRRGLVKGNANLSYGDAYKRLPVAPTTLSLSDISRVVTKWREQCLDVHENCSKRESDGELPTRVIDIGTNEAATPRLYEPKGKKAPYVALTHCWGGAIPSITTEANKTARADAGVNFDELPQNFKDAIHVSRTLGIRYLWIDALCIIQDSKTDWFREAGKMASFYAGASVVISALEAPASTAGFLRSNRAPMAILNDEFAVQKTFPQLYEHLLGCALIRRGWCMQERLLAPTILHFAKERMFWECRSGFKCEDGSEYTGQSTGHVMGKFIAMRKRIGVSVAQGRELGWQDWYQLLEEYTTRELTVSSDKLPALAGAAALFKSTKPAATYAAGLWKEDLARGLLWGAHYDHMPGRKVWGYVSADRCTELVQPPEKRAPSWSWAALDGQIDFWALRMGTGGEWFETLDVTMRTGENELVAIDPASTVKIRGAVARMFYHAPTGNPGYDVGSLTFVQDDSLRDEATTLRGCVMDRDRPTSRLCWAVIAARSNVDWHLLVLDKQNDGSYWRIGLCTAYSDKVDPGRFEIQDIVIN